MNAVYSGKGFAIHWAREGADTALCGAKDLRPVPGWENLPPTCVRCRKKVARG